VAIAASAVVAVVIAAASAVVANVEGAK